MYHAIISFDPDLREIVKKWKIDPLEICRGMFGRYCFDIKIDLEFEQQNVIDLISDIEWKKVHLS